MFNCVFTRYDTVISLFFIALFENSLKKKTFLFVSDWRMPVE